MSNHEGLVGCEEGENGSAEPSLLLATTNTQQRETSFQTIIPHESFYRPKI